MTMGRGWSRLTSTTCSSTSRPGEAVSISTTSGRIDGQAGFIDDFEAGLDQRASQAPDLAWGVVDQQDAQHA